MGCQIHSLNPQLLYPGITTKSKQLSKCSSFQPNLEVFKTTTFSSYNLLNYQLLSTATIKQTKIPESDVYNVTFKTLGACKLGISRYPDFEYNAEGGRGSGTATKILDTGEVSVDFDIKELYISPLSSATAKFLRLPLPPFLRIDIVSEAFQGKINPESGKVGLKFRATFCFSVGTIYKAPPLLVETVLASEESEGKIR
ncbi:hypothetical protein CDL12_00668 [Handroanthus impetiginosus]|uniref:Uncharacterized protein n=1 Tax=Handroanthus impetiginosus TaxID=429701 RepID=A0A2G9I9Z9_9LAMI|nr:hypothetical protein CDL12_00668 [Handroanthus impetiginosus]